jgi:uncharacterized membrane protein YhaH (DUF805 family)
MRIFQGGVKTRVSTVYFKPVIHFHVHISLHKRRARLESNRGISATLCVIIIMIIITRIIIIIIIIITIIITCSKISRNKSRRYDNHIVESTSAI